MSLLGAITLLSLVASDWIHFSCFFVGPHHGAITARAFSEDIVDVPPLLLRTSECTTFLQTRSYWHEAYTPGVEFYRPLSLTWFWFEYHLFGPDHFELWMLVSAALQLGFCLLFFCFVTELTGSTAIGVCTILIFAGYRSITFLGIDQLFDISTTPPSLAAVLAWKDQPTLLADCCIVSAMIFALRQRWLAGLFVTLCGVFFKESGWIGYALVLTMLVVTGRLRTVPTWVYFTAIVTILIPIAARASAGMGLIGGEQLGTNSQWLLRYVLATCGDYINCCIHSQWAAALTGTGIFYIFISKQNSLILKTLAALALLSVGAGLTAYEMATPYVVGAELMLSPSCNLPYLLKCFVFTSGIYFLSQDGKYGPIAWIFVALSLVSAIPLVTAAQISSHALNLCFAFQSAIVAASWVAGYQRVAKYFSNEQLSGKFVIQSDSTTLTAGDM